MNSTSELKHNLVMDMKLIQTTERVRDYQEEEM